MEELDKINKKLSEMLSPKKGCFGRVLSWGQRPTKYVNVGFVLSEDFKSTLAKMSKEQRTNLVRIINYFEIHALPLKKMLDSDEKNELFSEMAWSHFSTIIMFGMLEMATKGGIGKRLKNKGEEIKNFLEKNLCQDIKDEVVDKYFFSDDETRKAKNFGEVIDHMWKNIRSNFVHDLGVHYKGLEYGTFVLKGEKDGIQMIGIQNDFPMSGFLKITWQAILSSYGFKGKLEHSKLL